MNQNYIDPSNINVDWGYRTILIVEDVEPNYRYLKSALVKTNAKIEHASSGLEAINKCANNNNIDIVLMDLHMPEMSGLAATKEIKKIRQDIVIVAHTAFVYSGERQKSLDAGCDDYIAKPIRADELIIRLKNTLLKAGKNA